MGLELLIAAYLFVQPYLISALISYGISYAAQQLFGQEPEMPTFDNSIKENLQGGINPIPVIYGRRTVGGSKVFSDVSGTENKLMHTVLVLGEGEVHSIEDVFLDDISIGSDDWKAGYAPDLVDQAWAHKHTGSDTQTVDTNLTAHLPDKWTVNHRLQGLAYVYVILEFNRDVFDRVPIITADVKGVKVYDPRTTTTAWSDNPALCLRDYLTNTRYGRGIPESMIDDDAITAAANYCEQQVTFYGPTGSSYQDNRYRCNGAISVDDSSLDNVKKILSSCRGMLVFSAGKYKLVIDKPETAAFEFDSSNIVGKIAIGLGDKSVIFNRMRVRYFDEDLKWEQSYFTYDNSTLRSAQDNDLVLEGSLDLMMTSEIVRVEQIAQMEVMRSRQSIVCSFDSTLESLVNDVGDVVTITHARAGWASKPFRVVKIGLKSEDTVEVSLKEYDASVYSLDAYTPPSEPDTLTPGAYDYDPPNNVSVTSGNSELLLAGDGTIISRIRIAWTSPENGYCTGFEAGFKLSTESAWTDYALSGDVLQHLISPVQDGTDYDLRVRAVYFNGGHSAWVESLDHTVNGKSALPDTPTNFSVVNDINNIKTFAWDEVANLDLRGYRIRYKTGTTGEWADMTSLHSGNLIGSPWETSSISATGAHRFGLVAIDTSGNASAPVYFNLTLETTGESTAAPSAPTGIAATAMYLSVFLEWTNPTSNFGGTEVWISDTNDRTAATLLATTVAPIFQIEREDGATAYVWLRSVNTAGVPGTFNTADTAGTSIAALTTIDATSAAAITATSAKIATLYAANIAAGEIQSGTVIIGSGGAIRSHDYEPATQGWKIDAAGAELVSAIIRGTISAGGAIQSANYQADTAGFRISGDGSAEFHDINIYGEVPVPQLFVGAIELVTGSIYLYLQSVTITVSTSTGTTGYYTTDGTVPNETSDEIPTSGEITLSGQQVLRVIAIEDLTDRKSAIHSTDIRAFVPVSVRGRNGGTATDEIFVRSYYGSTSTSVKWGISNAAYTPPASYTDGGNFAVFYDLAGNPDGFVSASLVDPDATGYFWFYIVENSQRVGNFYVRQIQTTGTPVGLADELYVREAGVDGAPYDLIDTIDVGDVAPAIDDVDDY